MLLTFYYYMQAIILSQMQHPNIIELYGVSTKKPDYFLITGEHHLLSDCCCLLEHNSMFSRFLELISNGSLSDVIYEKEYQPDSERSLKWAKDIALGMYAVLGR